MRLARLVYRVAAVYGVIVTLPGFFLEARVSPPPNHPEQYYGFLGVVLAWQLAFWVIAGDPVRYRPLMPVTWVEKAGFATAAIVLFVQGRVDGAVLAVGVIDAVLCVAFVVAWLKIEKITTEARRHGEMQR